jgi:hypothetical protein
MIQLRHARSLALIILPMLGTFGMLGCACERWDREPNGVPPRTHPIPERDGVEHEDVSEGEGRPALSPPPPAMPPHSPRGHDRVEEHHPTEGPLDRRPEAEETADRHPDDGA